MKKKNGKWRVCIDFTNLNEACPKDSFPLSRIDKLVEAMMSHELLRSWTPTPDITRSRCTHQMKTIPLSLLVEGFIYAR